MAHLYLADQPVGPTLYLHGQRKRFYVPGGLESLMEEMTREVLRQNPSNLYEFLANFCEEKLDMRDAAAAQLSAKRKERRHSWEWRTWSTDGSSVLDDEELKTFVEQYDVPIEAAEHLATIIQAVYRGFEARKDFKKLVEENKRHRDSLWDEWIREGKFFTEGSDIQEILRHYNVTVEKANECATKIQAMFRGHLVRKSVVEEEDMSELAQHLRELGITQDEAEKQALKIQTFFRGHKTRKELKEKAQKLIDREIAKAEEEELRAPIKATVIPTSKIPRSKRRAAQLLEEESEEEQGSELESTEEEEEEEQMSHDKNVNADTNLPKASAEPRKSVMEIPPAAPSVSRDSQIAEEAKLEHQRAVHSYEYYGEDEEEE